MRWSSVHVFAPFITTLAIVTGGCARSVDSSLRELRVTRAGAGNQDATIEARRFEASWGGAVRRHDVHLRVQRLILELATRDANRGNPIKFSLLRSPQRAAFSLLPDRIYISAGLYEHLDSDRLLAAVLAHELAHLDEDESTLSCIDGVPPGLVREIDADQRAAQMLQNAGYKPADLIDALQTVEDLQPDGWFEQRASALRSLDPALAVATADPL